MPASRQQRQPRGRSRDAAKPAFQRNALAPGILGAIAAFVGPALLEQDIHVVVLFAMAILALIVAVFAGRAGQWWWIPFLAAIAVAWNPLYPFPMEGPWWTGAHVAAGFLFLTVGALAKERVEE